eukprot:6746830-Prymnesium_polylepis.1
MCACAAKQTDVASGLLKASTCAGCVRRRQHLSANIRQLRSSPNKKLKASSSTALLLFHDDEDDDDEQTSGGDVEKEATDGTTCAPP